MSPCPDLPARMRPRFLVAMAIAAAGALVACAPVPDGSGKSLNESRLGVIKGTAPGIVLIEAPVAPASGAAPARATAPPSGQPLRDATRLDSPGTGITLPGAAPASSADGRPRTGG